VRTTEPAPEPVSPPAPLTAAVRADDVAPVATSVPVSLAPSKPAESPPPIPASADYTAAAPSSAPHDEAYPERDMTGWFDRTFVSLDTDPEKQKFVMTTDASGDPRSRANRLCAEVGHIAVLVKAERTPGAAPDDAKIAWHFACRY
jgi:hypothetical protein